MINSRASCSSGRGNNARGGTMRYAWWSTVLDGPGCTPFCDAKKHWMMPYGLFLQWLCSSYDVHFWQRAGRSIFEVLRAISHPPESSEPTERGTSKYLLSVLAVGVISPGCSVVLAQSWACKLTVGKVCTGTVSTATMSGWLDLFSTSSEESQVMLARI